MSLHQCLSHKKKVNCWIFKRKEESIFLKKNNDSLFEPLVANAVPSIQPWPRLVEGRSQSGQERRQERSKEKWWRWAEITREREKQNLERGGETGYVTEIPWEWFFFRCFIFLYIGYWNHFIFFIHFLLLVCELLFFWCLVRVWIFIVFVDFWGWACLVICLVCFFLPSWIFFFFCKFNCYWRFFSSSGHVPTRGRLRSVSISRLGIEG